MRIRSWVSKVALLSAVLGFVACGDGNDSAESRVKVFHASPDAPNVDVLVDGGRVLENVPFGAASELLPLDVGVRNIKVNVTGTDITAINADVPFEEGTDYLVVAVDKVAKISPLVLETSSEQPEAGNALVRVLHAAPSAPTVDIYVTGVGGDITNASPTVSALTFKDATTYLSVPAGTYDVFVTPTGTKTVAIEAKGLEIKDQLVATVAALDAKGGGAPFALSVLDDRN